MRQRLISIVVIFFLALTANAGYRWYGDRLARRQAIEDAQKVIVPQPQSRTNDQVGRARSAGTEFSQSSMRSSASSSKPVKILEEVNWKVPFTVQAPLGEWDAAHEEACEEASVLMVLRYFSDQTIPSPKNAEQGIQMFIKQNAETLEFPVSQTVQQVAALLALNDRSKQLKISVKSQPTVASIKSDLSAGRLIIVPAYGRALGNPYYRSPGPLYHMLVLKGYTRDGFLITNDPGTKRGENYPYLFETILAANHDWNDGDVEHGDRAVIVVGKYPVVKKSHK